MLQRLHKESDPECVCCNHAMHLYASMPPCICRLSSIQSNALFGVGYQIHDEPSFLGTSLDSVAGSELPKLDLQVPLYKPGMHLWLNLGQSDSSKNVEFGAETSRDEELMEESYAHVHSLEWS